MTCIVGLKHEGQIYMGGDKAATDKAKYGYPQTIIADSKVFANGPFVMGVAGSPRFAQLMEHAFAPPPHEPYLGVNKYMVTTFVDAMRQTFKAGGLARREWEQEEAGNSALLVGYRGCLFEVTGGYAIEEARDCFHAIGAGREVARGALFASEGKDPCERVLMALEAAERVNPTVRRPFTIACQKTHSVAVVEYDIIEIDSCVVHEDDREADSGTPYSPAA